MSKKCVVCCLDLGIKEHTHFMHVLKALGNRTSLTDQNTRVDNDQIYLQNTC